MNTHLLPCALAIALVFAVAVEASAEDAPPRWISYGEWRPVGLATSYYNPEILQDNQVGLWFNAHFQGHDAVINLVGPDLENLERVAPQFDAQIIKGYDQDLGSRASPLISRASATRLRDGSVVVLASIGPQYDGGRSELYPALFHSGDGKRDWQHLGPPGGEAQVWLDEQRAAGKKIRCEGAGIIQLPDGRLRMYQQNLGARLAILEADTVHGPWRFVRNRRGEIHNVLDGLNGGWLFPHVAGIGEHGFLLTGGNTWPPTEIHAAISNDGIQFRPIDPGNKPSVIFRPSWLDPQAQNVKALRVAWDGEQQRLLTISNPYDGKAFPLFWTWATVDLSIFKPQ